jgi:para-aminobenzoate synthetase component 1
MHSPICRFEDRLAGQSLAMHGLRARIVARQRDEVPMAFEAIAHERAAGRWLALLLDYELGEWLLPETGPATPATAPRLVALSFDHATHGPCWAMQDGDDKARICNVTPRMLRADYLRRVAGIRDSIAAGEFYQVNYTQPLDVTIAGEPAALYRAIAARHPAAHAAYIEDESRTVLSFSPELFVCRQGSRLVTRPMKGTAPRHSDPAEDQRLADELLASTKNRAENLMIVDLLRNDLGRLAQPGSVRVDDLFTLERYPSVWTMTSTVSADAPDVSLAQVLTALFPCGSVTGAPKIAAIQRIRQDEIAPRGLYCGSVGWIAPNGDFSLNVAIRTLVLNQGHHSGVYHVGGGIVHDSDPGQEWQECLWKARILQDIDA